MPKLVESLHTWLTDAFQQTLKNEIGQLAAGQLPLHRCTTEGGMVDASNISITVIRTGDTHQHIQARLGVFFTEVIGGCNCADDPVEKNAYCELDMQLDKATAEATFTVSAD